MHLESESTAKQAIDTIIQNLNHALHINQLVSRIPEYNQGYPSRISHYSILSAELPHPPLKGPFPPVEMREDHSPQRIAIDEFATGAIQPEICSSPMGHAVKESAEVSRKLSSRYRRTGESMRASMMNKMSTGAVERQKMQLEKYSYLPPFRHVEPYQLPQREPSREEYEQELELRAIQKRMYHNREVKKLEEMKEQERLLQLKRRKSPPLPKTDFTYSFEGKFMKRKIWKNTQDLADEMKVSHSFDQLPRSQKKALNELIEGQLGERGRSQMGSRYRKTSTFNNFNRRQISHLPFIQLAENSKIREESKVSEGNKTERITLKNFEESNEEKGFKHHIEIEKEKRQRELFQKLQASKDNMEEELTAAEIGAEEYELSSSRRRQSYMMSKYLRKLRDQNPQAHKKSFNFSRASFPRNTAIHNYYKHDFNTERRAYESEIFSKALDAPSMG